MKTIVIEHDIPIPSKRQKKVALTSALAITQALKKMQLGDSFHMCSWFKQTVYNLALANSINITVRKESSKMIRVWRVS